MNKDLTIEFDKMIDDWIASHNLACATCKNKTDKNKDGCKLKVYCIVKHKHGVVGYEPVDQQ